MTAYMAYVEPGTVKEAGGTWGALAISLFSLAHFGSFLPGSHGAVFLPPMQMWSQILKPTQIWMPHPWEPRVPLMSSFHLRRKSSSNHQHRSLMCHHEKRKQTIQPGCPNKPEWQIVEKAPQPLTSVQKPKEVTALVHRSQRPALATRTQQQELSLYFCHPSCSE